MLKAYGPSWSLNAAGVTEMLTAPGQVIVLEGAMLEQVVRQAVNVALSSAEQEFDIQPQEPAFRMSEVADTAALPSAEELPEKSFVEPSRDTSIFAEPVGNGTPPAQPVQSVQTADEVRREFVRNFIQEQRTARGLIPN
jgi:hypothetical protein